MWLLTIVCYALSGCPIGACVAQWKLRKDRFYLVMAILGLIGFCGIIIKGNADSRKPTAAEPSPIIMSEPEYPNNTSALEVKVPATQPRPKDLTLVERIINPTFMGDRELAQFFKAILQLEGGMPNIQEGFWDDAMDFANQDWDYHKYRDTFRWKWAAIFYFRRYNPIAWSKKDWLSLARTYRGGPDGHKQVWTLDYGLELMRIMDYLKQDESRRAVEKP